VTKISLALASLLVLASAASDVAFAAMPHAEVVTQGEAYDECRAQQDPAMNDHHAYPAIEACVQRLTHVNQSTAY
jgi:hypothetical protein